MDGRLIIADERIETSQKLVSTNPATLEPLGEVSLAGEEECRKAIEAAKAAERGWRELPIADKKKIFLRAKDILLARAGELADLVCREKGSPIVEANAVDVITGLEILDYYGRHLDKARAPRKARLYMPLLAHKKSAFLFQPLGVTLIISPWNFPFVIPLSDTTSALAAGNTVVLRPSSTTPLTGLFIGELYRQAGLPPGVLNVVNSRVAQAEYMITHPAVQTVMFTGSVGVGRRVMELAAKNLTHIVLELGGKDPMVVLDDADLDLAARGAVWAGFMNTGQSCASVERVYADEKIAEAFTAKVLDLAKSLRVGDPLDPDIEVGPMTTRDQRETVEAHIADARTKGAHVLCGGERLKDFPGYFLTPAVVSGVDHTMKIMTEETFGPVLPIMAFKTLEEAVALANDCEYGLTASVWTRSKTKARWLAERIEAGTVTVNDHMFSFTDPKAIWGGVKKTGVGRSHGPYGLLDISNIKLVSTDFHRRKNQLWWYPYDRAKWSFMRNAIVILHHRKLGAKLKSLGALLPQWRIIKAGSSPKNLWKFAERFFR
ncbi:MAG TPA: aldehyde dehydrogenase family protein [Acidobacteriota bacterium]|nr:aldehyde dehydrogenase family protein [Acidobacteriota bacterium]